MRARNAKKIRDIDDARRRDCVLVGRWKGRDMVMELLEPAGDRNFTFRFINFGRPPPRQRVVRGRTPCTSLQTANSDTVTHPLEV